MKIYSDFPAHRIRQFAGDIAAIVVIIVSVILGVVVHTAVLAFGALGAGLEIAGSGLQSTMTSASNALGNVPLFGNSVRAPFDEASDAGAALASAGSDQQALVARVALMLGVLVVLGPIVIVVKVWILRRMRFARRAAEAHLLASTPGGLDLLALRAIGSGSPTALLAIHPDPAGAWRRGEASALHALARLELAASGIRHP